MYRMTMQLTPAQVDALVQMYRDQKSPGGDFIAAKILELKQGGAIEVTMIPAAVVTAGDDVREG